MTVRPLQSAWRLSRNELSGKPGAVTAAEDEIPWLARDTQKWTKARVDATFGHQRPSNVAAPAISDLPDPMGSIIPPVPAHQVSTSVKKPERGF